MYKGKSRYRDNMLRVIDEDYPLLFKMSSPSKISKQKGKAFSLPAGPAFACPGATEACVDCYAQKGNHNYPNVMKAFSQNWQTFKYYEERGDLEGCVNALNYHMPDVGLFRIHESGDFHSQFAVDAWAMLAQINPNVDFYTYTRSFDLNYAAFLQHENTMLWASTDSYNTDEAKRFVHKYKKVRHAYGPWDKKDDLPDSSFICPATSGKLEVEGACTKCYLCVSPTRTKKNVVFLVH